MALRQVERALMERRPPGDPRRLDAANDRASKRRLELAQAQPPRSGLLMLSMHDSEQFLFEALKAGASGYVLKAQATTRHRRGVSRDDARPLVSFRLPRSPRSIRDYVERGAHPASTSRSFLRVSSRC